MERLRQKNGEKIPRKYQKKASVVILLSDKIDIKTVTWLG